MKKNITLLTCMLAISIFVSMGSVAMTPLSSAIKKSSEDKSSKCEAQWEQLPKEGDQGIYFGGRGIIARKILLTKDKFMTECKQDFQRLY